MKTPGSLSIAYRVNLSARLPTSSIRGSRSHFRDHKELGCVIIRRNIADQVFILVFLQKLKPDDHLSGNGDVGIICVATSPLTVSRAGMNQADEISRDYAR